jgi:hypothetical protein
MAAPLSLAALVALAQSVGFPDPSLAAAVAMAESRGVPDVVGDPQAGGSYGLWQINLPSHPQYKSNPTALFDPTFNARAAFQTSSAGRNWQPWTTYRTGAYKKWYVPATPPPPAPRPRSNALPCFFFSLLLGMVAMGRTRR